VSAGNDDLETWKRRRIIELAFELADSGQYEDFTDIAYALQFERGLAMAQSLIDDADMRRRLNERCGNARELHTPVIEPEPPQAEEAVHPVPAPEPAPIHAPSWFRRGVTLLSRTAGTSGLKSAPS
jgi:hypothetical protein